MGTKKKPLPQTLINAVMQGDGRYVEKTLTKKFLKTHDINAKAWLHLTMQKVIST